MSIWTKFRNAVVGVAAPVFGGMIGGPAGAALGSALTTTPARRAPSTSGFSLDNPLGLPSLNLPGGNYTGPGLTIPDSAYTGQCPPGYHLDKKSRSYCVRNRTMNPLNHKANMRAARRLVKFRKAVNHTEKALRKAVPPSRSRRR